MCEMPCNLRIRGVDPGILYDRITALAKSQMKDQGWAWVEGGVKRVQKLQRIGPASVSDVGDTSEGELKSEGGIILSRSISAPNKVSTRNTAGSVSLGIGILQRA